MACPPVSPSANCPPIVPPTAVQALGDTHATPWSEPPDECAGCGVGCISQRDPFQRSTNDLLRGPTTEPTATHTLTDVQETPVSVELLERPNRGVR